MSEPSKRLESSKYVVEFTLGLFGRGVRNDGYLTEWGKSYRVARTEGNVGRPLQPSILTPTARI